MSDGAYLHCVLHSSSAFNDYILRKSTKTTVFHLSKTIALLNKILTEDTDSVRDSSVAVVVNLVTSAEFFGDQDAAKAHLRGLQQMVRLRGGLDGFAGNSKLHIKLGQ